MAGKKTKVPSGFLDVGQMAETCGVSAPTIRRWVKAGLLPMPIGTPGKFLWKVSVLDTAFEGAFSRSCYLDSEIKNG